MLRAMHEVSEVIEAETTVVSCFNQMVLPGELDKVRRDELHISSHDLFEKMEFLVLVEDVVTEKHCSVDLALEATHHMAWNLVLQNALILLLDIEPVGRQAFYQLRLDVGGRRHNRGQFRWLGSALFLRSRGSILCHFFISLDGLLFTVLFLLDHKSLRLLLFLLGLSDRHKVVFFVLFLHVFVIFIVTHEVRINLVVNEHSCRDLLVRRLSDRHIRVCYDLPLHMNALRRRVFEIDACLQVREEVIVATILSLSLVIILLGRSCHQWLDCLFDGTLHAVVLLRNSINRVAHVESVLRTYFVRMTPEVFIPETIELFFLLLLGEGALGA